MEIKDIIRKRREELNLTYEQLGHMVGVGKSTVRKWETGMIENLKRDNIVALAKALNISPALIMGLDAGNEVINQSNSNSLTSTELILLKNFNKLNLTGKEKLIEYSNDLIETPKYMQNTVNEIKATKEEPKTLQDLNPTLLAAHDDDLTENEKTEMDNRILEALKKQK